MQDDLNLEIIYYIDIECILQNISTTKESLQGTNTGARENRQESARIQVNGIVFRLYREEIRQS